MHELDQMTPNQRLNAFMTGQSMDRMLAMPVIVSMSGDVCGMTHREKRSSPAVSYTHLKSGKRIAPVRVSGTDHIR